MIINCILNSILDRCPQSSVEARSGSPPPLSRSFFLADQISMIINRFIPTTLSQVIYAFWFPRGLSLPTSPCFTNNFTHWWATPVSDKSILLWCTRLALLYWHHFLNKVHYSPYLVIFVKSPGKLQGLRQEAWCIELLYAILQSSLVVYHFLLQLF